MLFFLLYVWLSRHLSGFLPNTRTPLDPVLPYLGTVLRHGFGDRKRVKLGPKVVVFLGIVEVGVASHRTDDNEQLAVQVDQGRLVFFPQLFENFIRVVPCIGTACRNIRAKWSADTLTGGNKRCQNVVVRCVPLIIAKVPKTPFLLKVREGGARFR